MDSKLSNAHADEKGYASDHQHRPLPTYMDSLIAVSRDRSVRRLTILLCIVTTTWIFIHQTFSNGASGLSPVSDTANAMSQIPLEGSEGVQKGGFGQHNQGTSEATLVPLEAHIMSKCPDAKRCLQELIIPSMEAIDDKVNFTLSFIGKTDSGSDAVECKHGPAECLGNEILLCAAHLYPQPILYLGYTNCLINDYKKIPDRELVEQCALEHGLEFEAINKCVSEDVENGATMLRDSVQRTTDANVEKSCTVRVAGEQWCIVDGGKWTGCDEGSSGVKSLVGAIGEKWKEMNPSTRR